MQLTTDGLGAYLDAVDGAFGLDVDFAQLVTMYGDTPHPAGRYSPAECTGERKMPIQGNPKKKDISGIVESAQPTG